MLTTVSILAFLVASIAWIVGDALIVGFHRPDKTEHARFIALAGSDNGAFYTRINNRRLAAGALIGQYTAPLFLAGLWAHWVILRDAAHPEVGLTGLALLAIGIIYSPLAHAGFYPLALASARLQEALDRSGTAEWEPDAGDPAAHSPEVTACAPHVRRAERFLALAWVPSIGAICLGWLIICVPLAAGWTALPRWAVLFTPLVQMLPWSLLPRLPYPGKPLLNGALFNIVNLVWAIALLCLAPGLHE
ncbi:hypothetical protein ACSL103130_08120 [Actinomyces slackii]|uniref:Uncharacterized protein n=1 Tax=Actinomyces slackii TaxID=52774 RepID=A0A3S4SKF0_9ACTO|nr:hypothetical protein [Actinomyces slackii]VEG74760.1 Uncharacterised protein [Actinomyces slackii]